MTFILALLIVISVYFIKLYYERKKAADTVRSLKTKKSKQFKAAEKEILVLAQTQGGLVSLSEVALQTSLSIDESKILMEGLIRKGIAEIDINENGRIIYIFPDFEKPEKNLPQ